MFRHRVRANHPLMQFAVKVRDGQEKKVVDGRMNVLEKHLEVSNEKDPPYRSHSVVPCIRLNR